MPEGAVDASFGYPQLFWRDRYVNVVNATKQLPQLSMQDYLGRLFPQRRFHFSMTL